jgi:predicted DNA-binding transcriptional regulator YafY
MLNALTASATASSAVSTAPVLAIPDPVTLLNAADSEVPTWLRHWRGLSRHPIWESPDPTAALLIHAAERSQSLRLSYQGGTMPGEPRLFSPALVFRVGQSDPLYVNGWCHHRKAHRTLRLDQITL